MLRLSDQTLRNKMSQGIFLRGVHYFRRQGEIGVRFKRQALKDWLEGNEKMRKGNVIEMARGYALGERR